MFTTKRAVILLAVIALGATACSNPNSVATVNDIAIDSDAVYPLAGLDASAGKVSADEFRSSLRLLIIQNSLLAAAEDDYGLTDLATDAARDAYLQSLSAQEFDALQQAINAGVQQGRDPVAAADYIVTELLIRETVRSEILRDETFLRSIYGDAPELLVNMCVSYIRVETEEEASAVLDRLNAGEAFASVAGDVSPDTQSPGGALPCPSLRTSSGDEFGRAVSQLDVGLAQEPIVTQFGYHIVDVASTDQPSSFDDLLATPERFVPPQLVDFEYTNWEDRAPDRADITVRSTIGAWFPATDAIQAPPSSP